MYLTIVHPVQTYTTNCFLALSGSTTFPALPMQCLLLSQSSITFSGTYDLTPNCTLKLGVPPVFRWILHIKVVFAWFHKGLEWKRPWAAPIVLLCFHAGVSICRGLPGLWRRAGSVRLPRASWKSLMWRPMQEKASYWTQAPVPFQWRNGAGVELW